MTWNRTPGRNRSARFGSVTAEPQMLDSLPTAVQEQRDVLDTLSSTQWRRAGRSTVLDVGGDESEIPIIATILGPGMFP